MSQDQHPNTPQNPLDTPDFDFQALKQDLDMDALDAHNATLDPDTQEFLDALEHASQSLHLSDTHTPSTESTFDDEHFDVNAFDEIKLDATSDAITPSVDSTPSTNEDVFAAAPKKKSFLDSFRGNKTKKALTNQPSGTQPTSKKNPNTIIVIALVALLTLLAVWFFLGRNNDSTEFMPPSDTPPVETSTGAPPSTDESNATDDATDTGDTTADTTATDTAPTAEIIDADAILQAKIPEDPALIKEEIDRLADKDAQLVEQSKLVDEQLEMLDKLTQAKEEQIALLEAQIAQLEQQKPADQPSN